MAYIDYKLYISEEVSIILPVGIDLTGSTKMEIHILKPDKTQSVWTTTIDGSDNTAMTYITLATDLNQKGVYFYQSYVEKGSLKKYGVTQQFEVFDKFD